MDVVDEDDQAHKLLPPGNDAEFCRRLDRIYGRCRR
jgi:hypothetical protein